MIMDTSHIIPPVDRELIKKELKQKHFLRKTNRGNKEIYITTAHLSPNIMREIGRLRELSFTLEGGGTGKDCDIDEFDTLPEPYCFKQLFVWSPEDEEIVGGYRFIHGSNMFTRDDGTIATPTSELFQYSDHFINDILPYTLELGRAFVQPAFQPGNDVRKGLYSLDNLWDGIGGLALEIPETLYFFGKITMYPQMNRRAKEMILYFLQKHFPDRDGMVWPYKALEIESDFNELHALFCGRNYKEDYQILLHNVRALGCTVPAMINAYINLSPTMRCFGTAMNHEFGETDETGILVTINDIIPDKRQRYIESYESKNRILDRIHLFKTTAKRMPWWRKTSDEESESLQELRDLKDRQRMREELREKQKELRLELKNIRKARRKLKKDDKDED